MSIRTALISLSAVFVSTVAFAGEKPGDAIAFLVKQMGASELHLAGHTPEMLFECGVDFTANDGSLRANFFHPNGGAKDIRATFDIGPKTKVKLFDEKNATVIVDNVYVVTLEDGTIQKSTYRARMEIALDRAGKLLSVNLGWNRDKQAPLMYRCVIN